MANPEHVAAALEGAEAIAEYRRANPRTRLDLSKAKLAGVYLEGADLSGGNLTGTALGKADLSRANLAGGELTRASLFEASLMQSNISRARLVDANLMRAVAIGADLSQSDCSGANFQAALLFRAKMADANLTATKLRLSGFLMADLPRALLTDADLNKADLTSANLMQANLERADLKGVTLLATNLSEADLTDALLGYATIGRMDLSKVVGLPTVKHEAPSSIGVDTLIASFRGAGNKLTTDLRAFFLAAGVPRQLLDALPGIVAEVKYYSSFISYGEPDVEFARQLDADLRRRGVSCWLYDMDATVGERTWGEIVRKRQEAEKMVVLCSAKSLVREGVLKEIEEQIDEDPAKLVPISLDDDWKHSGFRVMRGSRDIKPFLLERNYADFANFQYSEALERLLTGLRRETRRKRQKG